MKLLIGLPCYRTGGRVATQAISLLYRRHPDWQITETEAVGSLLTAGFNRAWVHGLNMRDRGEITHFLLLHDDVRPIGDDWLNVLLGEMEKHEADVLSAIIPIKDARGMTSTALDTDEWRPMRFTQHQIHESRPVTWTDERLLFNTGCLLVNFRGSWVEKVCFTINDRIIRNRDGIWEAQCQPEDWDFSRQCRRLGVHAFVTRAVEMHHFGINYFSSGVIWGEQADFQNATVLIDKQRLAAVGA